MPKNKEKELKKKIKLILLIFIGIFGFALCLMTNIIGMYQIANKESNLSGLVGFSIGRKSDNSNDQKKLEDDKKVNIAEKDILVNALPIIKLNNNKWDRIDSMLSGYETNEDGNLYFPNGYIAYCNKRFIRKVIFNEKYTGEVIGHLKVGTDLKTVEKKLGTPTFKSNKYIGYKTEQVYAFFYENEISIYPNINISNESLEMLLNKYYDKIYEKDRAYFLADIRNNYDDFEIEFDEENDLVTITSTLRRVVAKLNSNGDIEIQFYNGYQVALDETKGYIKESIYKKVEDDLVEIVENERVSVGLNEK